MEEGIQHLSERRSQQIRPSPTSILIDVSEKNNPKQSNFGFVGEELPVEEGRINPLGRRKTSIFPKLSRWRARSLRQINDPFYKKPLGLFGIWSKTTTLESMVMQKFLPSQVYNLILASPVLAKKCDFFEPSCLRSRKTEILPPWWPVWLYPCWLDLLICVPSGFRPQSQISVRRYIKTISLFPRRIWYRCCCPHWNSVIPLDLQSTAAPQHISGTTTS